MQAVQMRVEGGYGPWARRYREIVDWPVGWKVALVTGVLLPYTAAMFLGLRLLIPVDTASIDVPRLERTLIVWSALLLVNFLISYAAMRRDRHASWMIYPLILSLSTCLAYLCWLFGSFSTLFMMMIPAMVLAVSLLFDPRIGWFAFGVAILDWGGLASLEMAELIPYAPAVRDRSIDGLATPGWFVFQFATVMAMMLWVLVLSHVATNLRKAQQGELRIMNRDLGEARDRLQRGNDLIRRYVPGQLAARILGDGYQEPRRPERRKLTIFFSDIEGFTTASDQLDPEVLSGLLNEYLSEMVAIAESHGGTVNQFVGDAIMTLFGAPEATNDRDHAVRAVRMSLEMQDRMVVLQQKWSREGISNPFRIRVGINTGPVNVGNFGSEGRMTYTAIGRETNLAARLESACTPGRVLISHSTWELVRDELPCTPRGEIQVKGIRDPVRVYEVA